METLAKVPTKYLWWSYCGDCGVFILKSNFKQQTPSKSILKALQWWKKCTQSLITAGHYCNINDIVLVYFIFTLMKSQGLF